MYNNSLKCLELEAWKIASVLLAAYKSLKEITIGKLIATDKSGSPQAVDNGQ